MHCTGLQRVFVHTYACNGRKDAQAGTRKDAKTRGYGQGEKELHMRPHKYYQKPDMDLSQNPARLISFLSRPIVLFQNISLSVSIFSFPFCLLDLFQFPALFFSFIFVRVLSSSIRSSNLFSTHPPYSPPFSSPFAERWLFLLSRKGGHEERRRGHSLPTTPKH